MKKLRMFLFGIFFLFSGLTCTWAAASTSMFDNMRTVIVVETTQDSGPARYMANRLKAPFRIPYYELKETTELLGPKDITEDTLRNLAKSYNADIVLVPVVRHWYWNQYHAFWHDEIITEYWYYLTIYAYNRKTDTFKAYSTNGSDRDEASVLNQPKAIMSDAMDDLMKKLSYKRIPTDLEELNSSAQTMTTKTTEGNAKIITSPSGVVAI